MIRISNDASINYDGLEIVSSIGESRFKNIYTLFIGDQKQQPIHYQRSLCLNILTKVRDVYDYEFLPYPLLDNQMDMNNVYDLIKFLDYDHINFLADVWRYLKVDLKTVDISNFCNSNSDNVLFEIEDQIKSHDFSRLVSIFIRTYIKDNLINWFVKSTEKQRMLIFLRILEGN